MSGSEFTATDTDLQDLQKRAFRYDAQDGLVEFLAGILFFFVARAAVDPHLAWVPALLVFPMRFTLRFFKRRFVYPRAGLVKLKGERGRDLGKGMLSYLAFVVLFAAAALWVFGDIGSWELWMQWLPAILGGLCAGGFIYLAGRTGYPRHWFLVAVSVGWGLACSLMTLDHPYEGIQRWSLGLGLVCLLTGVIVFLNFLRTHPVRATEVSDGQV